MRRQGQQTNPRQALIIVVALFALAATATTIMSAQHIKSTKTEVILVRHGECEMNLEVADKVGGRASASPLTAKGEVQASKLGRWLRSRGVRFDRVVASTAVRAKRTAELMLAEMDDPPQLELDSNLEEMTQGDWEGQPRSECYTEKTQAAIDADPRGFAAPGGECVALANKFRQRSLAERQSFVQRAAAAKAAGFPSWKAMQREAQLHRQHEVR